MQVTGTDLLSVSTNEGLQYKCKGHGDTKVFFSATVEYLHPSLRSLQLRGALVTDQAFYLLSYDMDIELREPLAYITRIVQYQDTKGALQLRGLTHTVFLRSDTARDAVAVMCAQAPSIQQVVSSLTEDADAQEVLGLTTVGQWVVPLGQDGALPAVADPHRIMPPVTGGWSNNPLGRYYVQNFLDEELRRYVIRIDTDESSERLLLVARSQATGEELRKVETLTRGRMGLYGEFCKGRESIASAENDAYGVLADEERACVERWMKQRKALRDQSQWNFEERLKGAWLSFGVENLLKEETAARAQLALSCADAQTDLAMVLHGITNKRLMSSEEASHRLYLSWLESQARLEQATGYWTAATQRSPSKHRDTTTTTEDVLCQGMLGYCQGAQETWRSRPFVLTSTQLCLKTTQGMVPLLEVRNVRSVELEGASSKSKQYDFRILTKQGTLERFRCESREGRVIWIAALQKCVERNAQTRV